MVKFSLQAGLLGVLWLFFVASKAEQLTPLRIKPYVLEGAEWNEEEINSTVLGAAEIYSNICNFPLSVASLTRVNAPQTFLSIDEVEQKQLIKATKAESLSVFFIQDSNDGMQAYAYLNNAPTKNRGTIWLTTHIDKRCLARTLAHEMGHILLQDETHHEDPSNLMHYRCVASNLKGATKGESFSPTQCARLPD